MLSKNKGIRYNLLVPVTGITVQVCITEGHIRVYGSVSVPNPNPAFHDFFIELDESSTKWCGHAYVESCPTQSSPSRSRRDYLKSRHHGLYSKTMQ